jgi:serine/threonine protein kinase
MFKLRRKPESSSSTEVDFLNLCKSNVHSVKVLVHSGSLLNKRQCQDLSSKLSETAQNIEALVLYCGATAADFRPALESLNRYVEKAKVLLRKCREKDWCAAAVFQIQNENAFRDILLDLGLCYNAIYEQAKSTRGDWRDPPEDLRLSSMFASNIDVCADNEDFKKRLDDLANGYINLSWMDYFRAGKVTRKQSLARYLLVKMYCTSLEPQANTLDSYSAILWRKNSEPSGTWGNSHFLGAGSGASGVCSTEWLGIPCAKEFHGQESEHFFMKEAGILAHLKHPCIVNFICCGNGLERGDRFIAMELMEKSLYNLIEDHKNVPFSCHVVVDMMVQIARGVCYLHGQGVAHRDLKPQNVVVSRLTSLHDLDYYCVKLVDFGISKTKVEVSKSNTMTEKGIGTTRYRAPEVFPQAHPNGIGKATWFQADVYSFAMTCVHLLSLKTPLGEMQNLSELYEKLMNGKRPELPVDCPEELKALLKDCWNIQPRSRPSFTEVCIRLEKLKHATLRGFIGRNDGFRENNEGNEGIDFIKMKVEKELSIQKPILDGIGDEEVLCLEPSCQY